MERITYSQVRMRLAKIIKNVFTATFEEIYTSNCENYSEDQLLEINSKLSEEVEEFAHNIYQNRNNSSKLNELYSSVNPELICCFYQRYWMLINLLKMSEQISANEKIVVFANDEDLFYQLLFDVIDL